MEESKKIVKIYVLVDPVTLKVRYIGRTTCSLAMRNSQHVFKAKNSKLKTHRDNWILTLLKIGTRPIIRTISIVEGWSKSHELERALIHKHKLRHDLTNHYDRGEGARNKETSEETRKDISNTLKRKYTSGELINPANKLCYVYGLDGIYMDCYDSAMLAAKNTGVSYSSVKKCIRGTCKHRCGYQFTRKFTQTREDFTISNDNLKQVKNNNFAVLASNN